MRQVAPELMKELGEPFVELWPLLEATHGGREAGRIIARLLSAIVEHGQDSLTRHLKVAFDFAKKRLPEIEALAHHPLPTEIDIPESLKIYAVEAAKASDFDALLKEVASCIRLPPKL